LVVAVVVLLLGYAWWQRPAQPRHDAQTRPVQIEQHPVDNASADAGIAGGTGHDDWRGFQITAEDTPDPERARCHADRRRQLTLYLSRQATPATPEDAISTALLGVLASPDPGISASRALQAARQRWPENLDLAWINLLYCHANAGCDRNAALRHVAALDPQNASTWFNAMQQARLRKDEVTFDQALQRAADARFYDSRLGTVFLHVRPTLARLPQPDSCRSPQLMREMESDLSRAATAADYADIEALGLEHAIAMPAYATLSACKAGDPDLTDRRRANCLALLGMIAEGDTLLEQQIGLSYLLRLVSEGDSQTNAQRERYRRVLWLSANSTRYLRPMPRDYGLRMWSEGEVNLLRSLAIARGPWPPPADWLPDSEEQRALILGR
jgi:hypothetical protein